MLTPFVFFAVTSLVLVYMVGKYRRLPSAEFASRIRSAGTGRALRALALAAPGFLASMLFMTGACGLVLLSGSTLAGWERAAVLLLGAGCFASGALATLAAFVGIPRILLFPQARRPDVRRTALE